MLMEKRQNACRFSITPENERKAKEKSAGRLIAKRHEAENACKYGVFAKKIQR